MTIFFVGIVALSFVVRLSTPHNIASRRLESSHSEATRKYFNTTDMINYHPITEKITVLLREREMWFETFEHEAVRTSEEAAAIRPNYTIDQGTKALIVRVREKGEKKFVMVVVPGDKKFDPKKLKEKFGLSDLRFATEEEVAKITNGVMPGGVPPFGTLFGLTVYADECVFNNEKIIFNAGDRCFSVAMYSRDYNELVKPNRASITAQS